MGERGREWEKEGKDEVERGSEKEEKREEKNKNNHQLSVGRI